MYIADTEAVSSNLAKVNNGGLIGCCSNGFARQDSGVTFLVDRKEQVLRVAARTPFQAI
ncbi:hypothetical protein [Leisingera sp. S232]|uniref:hypothetical protein n=1 Tax=Leisingera sp. S232 TaxID=3415132 RepID=UPI003C7B7F46